MLRAAGLINTREEGRQRVNSLNVVPIRQIYERWVSQYEGFWADKLLRLREDIEADLPFEGSARSTERQQDFGGLVRHYNPKREKCMHMQEASVQNFM